MNSNPSPKFIRFRQRLSNLESACSFLEETLRSATHDRVKNAAIVKAFEMAFELCWKTLKDLLEYKGINTTTPRDTLKESFKAGYLENGQIWIDLLDKRNELVHVYHEDQAVLAAQEIQDSAAPQIRALLLKLRQE